MTATEVQARLELMARLMGPALSRIQTDFLDLVLKRTFKILLRYGMLPKVPQLVKDLGDDLDIEYRGPMARAQRMDKVMSIERWLGMIAQAAEIYPEMRDIPDAGKIARELGILLGVPTRLMKSKAEVKTIRELREQVQELQQQLEMAKVGSEAYRNVAQGGSQFGEGVRNAA